jgi:predicted nucleic acid-binding protein
VIYLLDANPLSDLLAKNPQVRRHLADALFKGDTLAICRPIHYELLRGLLWRGASGKLSILNQNILPQFSWIPLTDADWNQAAHYWAEARREGRQLSDQDLLLAALATRLDATLVSNDADYDVLPVAREDWRV